MQVLQMFPDSEELPENKITFDDFWAIYPRKMARKVASMSWLKINPKEYQAVLDGVMRARSSENWMEQGGKFIPFPATFLNQERWLDCMEVEIKIVACRWRGCSKAGTKKIGEFDFCETHFNARKRGESPV